MCWEEREFHTKTVLKIIGYQMYSWLFHTCFVFYYVPRIVLCSHRSHIWDKAPMRPHVRHNVLYEEEEIEGYSPKTLPKRCATWAGSHTMLVGSHIHAALAIQTGSHSHAAWGFMSCTLGFHAIQLGYIGGVGSIS